MKTHYLKTLISSLILLSACTYEPDETYFAEVAQIEPEIDISLNAYDHVTAIHLYNDATFSYYVNIGGDARLTATRITIDGSTVVSDDDPAGQFSLKRYGDNSRFMKTGTYKLKVEFTTTSGTGSLADKLKLEQYQVWREWDLIIDIDPPPTPNPVASIENGFLKISWAKYTKPNFKNYSVYKREGGTSKTITITNAEQNYFIDSLYVGGTFSPVEYSIGVSALEYRSNTIYRSDPYTFKGTFNGIDSMVSLQWTKPKFYNAVKEYTITYSGGVYHQTNLNDTTAKFKVATFVLGSQLSMNIDYLPKYRKESFSPSDYTTSFQPGVKMKLTNVDMYYNNGTHQLVGYRSSGTKPYIYFFDNSLNATDSILTPNISVSIPFNGTELFFEYAAEYGYIDLVTRAKTVKQHNLNRFGFNGSSKKLVAYNYRTTTSGPLSPIHHGKVIDMSTDTEIFTASTFSSNNSTSTILSPDGNFLFRYSGGTNRRIHKITGSTVTEVGPTNTEASFIGFREDLPHEIFMRAGYTLYVYNANDLSLIRTVALPFVAGSYGYGGYDPVTKNMMWINHDDANNNVVMNVETGASKTFRATGTLKLVAGKLFHSSGYYVKLL